MKKKSKSRCKMKENMKEKNMRKIDKEKVKED